MTIPDAAFRCRHGTIVLESDDCAECAAESVALLTSTALVVQLTPEERTA